MRAAVVEEAGGPFAIHEVALGDLRPDEVLVRVAASGICHTDLICRDQWYPVPLPAVLGHEGAGTIEAVGSTVTTLAPGDRVAMSYDSCGRCSPCRRGLRGYCDSFFELNFAAPHFFAQSSFATHSIARESTVVKLPEEVPFDVAAPFGCGIQTGAGSVLNVFRPLPGSSIAVFGAGAVGLAAILAARLAGCTTIVAVDLRANRLELAHELGATHTVHASQEDPVEAVGRVGYSLEATGSPVALRAAVDCLEPTGTCGVVGAPAFGTEVSLDVNSILVGGRTVRGIVEGDSIPQEFLPRLFAFWQAGRFPVERMMTYYDFDQINEAAHDAESGAVIKPVLRMS